MQPSVQDWKARISIRSLPVSQPLSSQPIPTPATQQSAQSNGFPHSSPQPSSIPHSLTPYLCYACHTTLTSRSSRGTQAIPKVPAGDESGAIGAVALPVWVGSGFLDSLPESGEVGGDKVDTVDEELWDRKKMGSAEMKAVVTDFLLE